MSRAKEVLRKMAEAKPKIKRTPLRIKDKEGVRRRRSSTYSLKKLLSATKKLRPDFEKHNKVELSSAILYPRTQQLVVKAQCRALTDKSRTAYPLTVSFYRVTSKDTKDATHKIPVQLGSGNTVYIKKLSVKDNPVNIRCGCFTGDTKVLLASGKEIELKDMKRNETYEVFSHHPEKGLVVSKAINAGLREKQASLVQVTLDNGEKIRCTPDHKFMKRDGTYVEAIDLRPSDSLMPFYQDNGNSTFNHKVKSVKVLLEKEDVYCLEVPELHNFVISGGESGGVVVHNCKDFYFTWWFYDFKNKVLSGPKMKPYTRKTPPPPKGYPYRNPLEVPGMCKHLNGLFVKLANMKILGN